MYISHGTITSLFLLWAAEAASPQLGLCGSTQSQHLTCECSIPPCTSPAQLSSAPCSAHWDIFCFSAASPAALSSSSSVTLQSQQLAQGCVRMGALLAQVLEGRPTKEPAWILCPESPWILVSQEGASGARQHVCQIRASCEAKPNCWWGTPNWSSWPEILVMQLLQVWSTSACSQHCQLCIERLLQNASKLHNSQRLTPIVQNSYISNSYVPYYKSNYSPVLFPLHPLFFTHRQGEHSMVLVLSLGTPESSMLYPLSSQGMFPLTSMPWVTMVDEWSFCSTWGDIGNPGKKQTFQKLRGDTEPWEKSGWSFILLHFSRLTLITTFFPFLKLSRVYC